MLNRRMRGKCESAVQFEFLRTRKQAEAQNQPRLERESRINDQITWQYKPLLKVQICAKLKKILIPRGMLKVGCVIEASAKKSTVEAGERIGQPKSRAKQRLLDGAGIAVINSTKIVLILLFQHIKHHFLKSSGFSSSFPSSTTEPYSDHPSFSLTPSSPSTTSFLSFSSAATPLPP
jgi:hypothetical protein